VTPVAENRAVMTPPFPPRLSLGILLQSIVGCDGQCL